MEQPEIVEAIKDLERKQDRMIGQLQSMLAIRSQDFEEALEKIATLETQLAEALKYGAPENATALSYVKNPCTKHNQYWTTASGACMACRAETAETQLAAANEAVRVLQRRNKALEGFIDGVGGYNDGCGCCGEGKNVRSDYGTDSDLITTAKELAGNPLARAAVEKAGNANE